MVAKKMSLDSAEDLLKKSFYGHLAMSVDDQPYVLPVNFAYDKCKIYIHCNTIGRKLDALSVNPKICLAVNEIHKVLSDINPCDFGVRFASVLAFGQAQIIDDAETKLLALNMIIEKYAAGMNVNKLSLEATSAVKVIVVNVDTISGKLNVDPEDL